MKKYFSVLFLMLAAIMLSGATIEIKPVTDKIWKVGETVEFISSVSGDDGKLLTSGSYVLTITHSGGKKIGKPIHVDMSKNNPFQFSASLAEPGFLMVLSSPCRTADGKRVKWANHGGSNPPHCGVAVEPEKIRPGASAPADFHQFWQEGIAAFKDAAVTLAPEKAVARKGYRVSRITIGFPDGAGAIDGFLAIPEKAGRYPLVVSVPGAGPGTTRPGAAYSPGRPVIMLTLNVHHFPTASTAAEQKKRYDRYNTTFPDKKIYIQSQAYDRDKYIFRNVWLAMNRAVDHVVAHVKEFDGKNVAAVGSSQGGATALALSYLNKNITCTVANVPGFCDHAGWKAGRSSGCPTIYSVWKEKSADATRYFDCANFAFGIKNPVLMSVGFADLTCPPAAIYAAYNNLQGTKRMYHMLRAGHTMRKDFAQEARKFLDRELFR